MRDASVTPVELVSKSKGVVCCGGPGRRKAVCSTPVVKDGLVIHHRTRGGYHGFSVAELLRAVVVAGQPLEQILAEYFAPQLSDPLALYRQIPGLTIMGPEEIERAFLGPDGSEDSNPLGLPKGWCRLLAPPVPVSSEELHEKYVKPSQMPEWTDCAGGCQPVLALMLSEISYKGKTKPVSPANLCLWFGQQGLVHQIQLSDWFLGESFEWGPAPVVLQIHWSIRWLDHPAWTTSKRWDQQQGAVAARRDIPGLRLGTGPEELYLMDILTLNGLRFREKTWTRTSTEIGGCLLGVYFLPRGVCLDRCWNPEDSDPLIGAAVAGDLAA